MPPIPRRLPRLLGRQHPVVPDPLVRAQRRLHPVLPFCSQLETHGQRGAVLHGLAGALDGGREEGVRGVADESDAGARGEPCGQRVAVDEFPVDETRGGRGFDDLLDDGVPVLDDLESVGDVARGGPGVLDVCFVLWSCQRLSK